MEDFLSLFERRKLKGSCETGAVEGWRLIRAQWPKAKILVVLRPLEEVISSLNKWNLVDTKVHSDLLARASMLETIASLPESMVVTFEMLEQEAVCQAVFEFCLQIPFDKRWWANLSQLNIQVNMADRIARIARNSSRLQSLRADVYSKSLLLLEDLPCFLQ